MFVLSVKDLVELDGLRTHEELQEMGKIAEWEDGMGDVMFVSQTWLRDKHPHNSVQAVADSSGEQQVAPELTDDVYQDLFR